MKISIKSIKSFLGKIWNYFPNQRKKELEQQKKLERLKLFNDIAEWYKQEVTEKRIDIENEKSIERSTKQNRKIPYFCPECKKTFYDYYSLNKWKPIECNKCIGLADTFTNFEPKRVQRPINKEVLVPVEPNKFDSMLLQEENKDE